MIQSVRAKMLVVGKLAFRFPSWDGMGKLVSIAPAPALPPAMPAVRARCARALARVRGGRWRRQALPGDRTRARVCELASAGSWTARGIGIEWQTDPLTIANSDRFVTLSLSLSPAQSLRDGP